MRSKATRLAGALLLAAGALVLGGSCGEERPTRPNVVVYLVDTLRRDHLGVYGYERETSPRLDEFAAEALVFEQAYSPTSWTRPATATLLTGLYPAGHQAVNLTHRIPETVELLGEHLVPLGYETAAFVTNANVLPVWGFDQGFQHFDDVLGRTKSDDAEHVVDAALAHLDEVEGPFFFYLHTVDPHGPYEAPEPFRRRFARGRGKVVPPRRLDANTQPASLTATIAAYDGEIAYNDAQFGRLLDALLERGLLDDTLVIFTSDHGDEHGDHGGGGHAHTLYQELVHVPLVVRPPASAANARTGRFSTPVGLLDVVPTVLAAAGAMTHPGLPGTDLVAIAGGQSFERALHFDLDMQRAGGDVHVARAVLQADMKLIRTIHPDPTDALYALEPDPLERRDLADSAPDELARLRKLMQRGAPGAAGGLRWLVRNDTQGAVRVFTGLLRTDGTIRSAGIEHAEAEDTFSLEEGGHAVRFRFVLRNYEDPYRDLVETIADEDVLVIELDPLDAPFRVESFQEEGVGEVPLHLGTWQSTARAAPLDLNLFDSELLVADAQGGRDTLVETLAALPAGSRLVFMPTGLDDAQSIEMDEDMRERLRALGYVE